jgi:apolipoprotein N-acyltransferase
VLYLTLPVLVFLLEGARREGLAGHRASADDPVWPGWRAARTAAGVGWWFALGFHVVGLYWLREAFAVTAGQLELLWPLAVIGLPAYLAIYHALAAAAVVCVPGTVMVRTIALGLALAVSEWLRGHAFTGFPWNVLGYALTYPLPLMQGAALFGAYGLTAIAAFVFPAPLVILADSRRRPAAADAVRAIAFAVVPIALLFVYGALRLDAPQTFVSGVKMRIVQPSVPQREKWLAEYQRRIFDDHLDLSLTNPQGEKDSLAGITHLVWPEAAMPFFPLEHPEALDILATVIPPGTTLITGALRHDPNAEPGKYLPPGTRTLNSILVLNERAEFVAAYDKIKLVPFGEYLPLEPILSSIGIQKLTHGRGSFSAGISPRGPLTIPGLPPALGLVCYEALFPGDIVQGEARPGVLVNVTNDGWFGNTTGPYQHFHQSRVRAVEEGVPLIRAANNGISAVIDPFGRALQTLGLNVRGAMDSPLPEALSPPIYARAGDWILLLVLALFATLARALGKSRC